LNKLVASVLVVCLAGIVEPAGVFDGDLVATLGVIGFVAFPEELLLQRHVRRLNCKTSVGLVRGRAAREPNVD